LYFVSRYKLLVRLPLERWRFCFSMSCLRSRSARARWTVRGESPNSRPADAGNVRPVPKVDIDRLLSVAQMLLGVDKVELTHLLPSML